MYSKDNVFEIEIRNNGLAILGINIPKDIPEDAVFFSLPKYGECDYVCTPKKISIPNKLEVDGQLMNVVEISGHPFEGCNDLEELVIPSSIRKIRWNGRDRFKLSKFTVHPDNPVFESVDGVLFTKKGYNRDGHYEKNCIELIAYPSAKGTSYTVPIGTTRLGNQSFKYTNISELILPETLLEIGTNVFYGCKYLRSLIIPSSVVKNEGSSHCSTVFIEEKK